MHYTAKRNDDPMYDLVILVMESPGGHREYLIGERWNMEQFIEDGYVTDENGFKWKAWIED